MSCPIYILKPQDARIPSLFYTLFFLYCIFQSCPLFLAFGSWLGNLGKKALTNIVIPLARDNLPGLVSNLTSNAINKFKRKIGSRE